MIDGFPHSGPVMWKMCPCHEGTMRFRRIGGGLRGVIHVVYITCPLVSVK